MFHHHTKQWTKVCPLLCKEDAAVTVLSDQLTRRISRICCSHTFIINPIFNWLHYIWTIGNRIFDLPYQKR